MTPTVDYPANNFENTHHRNLKTTLTSLIKKDAFSWTLEATKSFEKLKEVL
jgi:hypothetical protein